jgi:transposase
MNKQRVLEIGFDIIIDGCRWRSSPEDTHYAVKQVSAAHDIARQSVNCAVLGF